MDIFLNILMFILIMTGQIGLPHLFSKIRNKHVMMWTVVITLHIGVTLLWMHLVLSDTTWMLTAVASYATIASLIAAWQTSTLWHNQRIREIIEADSKILRWFMQGTTFVAHDEPAYPQDTQNDERYIN